MLSGIDLL